MNGDNICIFLFYIFLFELALQRKQEDKTTLLFIRNWSFVLLLPLFWFCYSSNSTSLTNLIVVIVSLYIDITILWIPIKEFYILIKICYEYKKIIPNDEEEKAMQNKNYVRLVIFGIIQLITFIVFGVMLVIQIMKWNIAIFPLPPIVLFLQLLYLIF